jgi:hypothetical protein
MPRVLAGAEKNINSVAGLSEEKRVLSDYRSDLEEIAGRLDKIKEYL